MAMPKSDQPRPLDEIKADYQRFVSIEKAAAFADVSTKTIRRRISDGTLHAARFGPRLLRVDLAEVEANLLRSTPAGGAA